MANSNTFRPGKHFLQIPGPTNVPDRVLRAMDYPTIDHRGPDFAEIGLRVLDKIKLIFKTSEPVIIFPASGTGAWEAAMVNTLSAQMFLIEYLEQWITQPLIIEDLILQK